MTIKWFGTPLHFICASRCRFHLSTELVEKGVMISTVGDMAPLRDAEVPAEEIGWNRKYETMVFKVSGHCTGNKCGCLAPGHNGQELEMIPANNAREANENHMAAIERWNK